MTDDEVTNRKKLFPGRLDPKSNFAVGGFALIYMTAASVAFGLFVLFRSASGFHSDVPSGATPSQLLTMFVSLYAPAILALLFGVFSAVTGIVMLQAAGKSTRVVIPESDRDLLNQMLSTNNSPGIDAYIRLSSLTGISSAFTKVGLSGLPLATILLTVFFATAALIPSEKSGSLFDLAKLTLGAFIGSYVQRQSTETKNAG